MKNKQYLNAENFGEVCFGPLYVLAKRGERYSGIKHRLSDFPILRLCYTEDLDDLDTTKNIPPRHLSVETYILELEGMTRYGEIQRKLECSFYWSSLNRGNNPYNTKRSYAQQFDEILMALRDVYRDTYGLRMPPLNESDLSEYKEKTRTALAKPLLSGSIDTSYLEEGDIVPWVTTPWSLWRLESNPFSGEGGISGDLRDIKDWNLAVKKNRKRTSQNSLSEGAIAA